MLNKFQQYIEEHALCHPDNRLLVAVSGGIDSVVLLDLFVRSGYKKLAIAHCNFHLRGKESDEDEQFVRSLSAKYKLPVFVHHCFAKTYAAEYKISIEMAARTLRYKWFEQLMQKHGFQKLAIGHNRDDDAETFFIKLLRGSGLDGLKGIMPRRQHIIRPLLFAPRKDIASYATNHKLQYRDDSSNASDDYLRNRIRHHLLPYYETNFPGGITALTESLEKLKTTETVFNQLIAEKKRQILKNSAQGYFVIEKTSLQYLEPITGWLYFLLHDFGFNFNTVKKLKNTLYSKQSGQLFYTEKYVLLNNKNRLVIKEKTAAEKEEYLIENLEKPILEPIHIDFEIISNHTSFVFSGDKNTAYFDADKLKLPLLLRHWQKGDRFIPFGMQGSKLLSDFFSDEKINRFDREKVWLLLSNNKIIWIIGHRASDLFRVTGKTNKILKIKLSHK